MNINLYASNGHNYYPDQIETTVWAFFPIARKATRHHSGAIVGSVEESHQVRAVISAPEGSVIDENDSGDLMLILQGDQAGICAANAYSLAKHGYSGLRLISDNQAD